MGDGLSRLLSPVSAGSFLEHYQAREYLHVCRNSPDYYADLLSVADIDAVLQSEHLPAAFINVVKDGTRYPLEDWSRVGLSARGEYREAVPERLLDLYSKGATLVLTSLHRTLPSLNALCRSLTSELGFPTQANIYITPPGAAGFAKHVDDHEVLIFQIAGSKRWFIDPPGSPVVEIDLQCGDLLYLPRGVAHAAHSQHGDSIHVTLGLLPVYGFQLIEELATMASTDPVFQQPMPPLLAGAEKKCGFETEFLGHLEGLIGRTKPAELLERRFRAFVDRQLQGWPGRLSDMRRLPDIRPETHVCRRPGILTVVKEEGKSLNVEFAGKRVVVPVFLRCAVAKIMDDEAFAIADIDGFITGAGKVKLVSEFVKAGLLRIVKL